MSFLTILRIAACSVLWAALWGQEVRAQGSLPVPSLSFRTPRDGSNIELFSKVALVCTPPIAAPYPIVLILGRDSQPLIGEVSYPLRSANDVLFTIPAVAENEGTFACWYNVSRTTEVSGFSNSVNITVSSLPPPTVTVQPEFIPIGGNYTVYCYAPANFYNITLSFYFRNLLNTTGNRSPQLLGSVTLDNGDTSIVARSNKITTKMREEYLCKMEVFYNQRVYQSPFSSSAIVSVEEATVRLVSRYQGSQCGGQLEVFVRDTWAPVCHRGNPASFYEAMGRVVCRELGCGAMAAAGSMGISSARPGTLFVGPVECSGEEERLRDCTIRGVKDSCQGNRYVEIVCSDFLPAPELSVTGQGRLSSIYIHVNDTLNISCTVNAQWLVDAKVTITLLELTKDRFYSSLTVSSGQPAKTDLRPPLVAGQYACYARFHGFSNRVDSTFSNILTVTTGSWYRPSPGLIAGALITTLVGVGILVYLCICRRSEEATQPNLTPQEANTENPTTTSVENPVFNLDV